MGIVYKQKTDKEIKQWMTQMEESYKNLEVSLQLQRGSSYLFLETGSSQVNLEVPPGSDHTVIR